MIAHTPETAEIARNAKAWPFEEARKLEKRLGGKLPEKGYVLFETGYGPSGLPHIGTFGEVARTTMVRRAFEMLTGMPTRLFAFSDDMDGLRKVPDNVPNRDLLAQHLNEPLTKVPDPFGTHESFGHHNNARLRAFLDAFGFEYEFQSATDWYTSGRFDDALIRVLEEYDRIMEVMLPTLGEERQQTYSPFLPLSPKTGHVLQVPILERNASKGTVVFEDTDGEKVEVPVTGGHCKLQWKPDWAMRWYALGVDYEMAGKDLIPSVDLGGKITRILGGNPPAGFNYELFLDENGQKISKSKGNGLTIDEWLTYASPESLAIYIFQTPRAAKRLYFDVIPKAVDEYLTFLEKYRGEGPDRQVENPVWHIHEGAPPEETSPISFNMLLNLVSASNSQDRDILWGFISAYVPGASPASHPLLDRLVGYAIKYFEDFVRPTKFYRPPTAAERAALEDLRGTLQGFAEGAAAEDIQNAVFEVGKRHGFENLRDWFGCLYETLLGQTSGPRMGSFVALYGLGRTVGLIDAALHRDADAGAA